MKGQEYTNEYRRQKWAKPQFFLTNGRIDTDREIDKLNG